MRRSSKSLQWDHGEITVRSRCITTHDKSPTHDECVQTAGAHPEYWRGWSNKNRNVGVLINEMNEVLGHMLCTYRRTCMWGWWDEIRALTVWGRARYLSSTEAPHNIGSSTSERERNILFLRRQEWGSNPLSPTFQAGSFNGCTKAPALLFRYMYLFIHCVLVLWLGGHGDVIVTPDIHF